MHQPSTSRKNGEIANNPPIANAEIEAEIGHLRDTIGECACEASIQNMLQKCLIAAGRNEENIDLQFNEKQRLIVEHPVALSRHFMVHNMVNVNLVFLRELVNRIVLLGQMKLFVITGISTFISIIIIFKLWGGNMDLQPCGNVTDIAYYVAKYAVKHESQEIGEAVKDAVSRVQRYGGDIRKQLFAVSMTILQLYIDSVSMFLLEKKKSYFKNTNQQKRHLTQNSSFSKKFIAVEVIAFENEEEINESQVGRYENHARWWKNCDYNVDFDLHDELNETDHVISVEEFNSNIRKKEKLTYEILRSVHLCLQEFKTNNLGYISRIVEPILSSLEEFQKHDSRSALSRILNLTVNTNKHNFLHAGCHIKLSSLKNCGMGILVSALQVLNLAGIEFHIESNYVRNSKILMTISINVYTNEIVVIRLRNKNRKYFCNRKERVPFVVYANLECTLETNVSMADFTCIPVVFHNLSGCDVHFVKKIATAYEGHIDLLPIIKYLVQTRMKGLLSEYIDCIEKLKELCLPQSGSLSRHSANLYSDLYLKTDLMIHMPSHNPLKSSLYLMYYDVSNLYRNIFMMRTDLSFCPTREKSPDKDDKQSHYLHEYIELNLKFRTLVRNKFIQTYEDRYGAEAMIAKSNFHSSLANKKVLSLMKNEHDDKRYIMADSIDMLLLETLPIIIVNTIHLYCTVCLTCIK
ncbi:hypothetical protein ALC53_08067 [Atta colombica]|uniref:Uncharacterized protein n=1 Tax=Atta colombica TaxID=520822 RepID=A0A151I2Q1_9HYME|nr:hypothetical protein ALC53_08067 [Atta colombica]